MGPEALERRGSEGVLDGGAGARKVDGIGEGVAEGGSQEATEEARLGRCGNGTRMRGVWRFERQPMAKMEQSFLHVWERALRRATVGRMSPPKLKGRLMSTGRAVSAAITARLRAALESGRHLTYAELAREARCTERSVRNYLGEAADTLGLKIVRERGPDRRIRVRLAEEDAAGTIEDLGRVLAKEMLRRVFPVAGTSLDEAPRRSRAAIIVGVRGAYTYEEWHLRVLRDWLRLASVRPRREVRFEYEGTETGLRVVWPLGIVVRDLARVYLIGVPSEATDARDVRTYALERVRSKRLDVLRPEDSDRPPRGIDSAPIEEAMDLPFSVYRGVGGVQVHVQFNAEQARFMRGRVWHKAQRVRSLKDGTLDVRFGPADLGEVCGWLGQWRDGVEVLGDARLVREWKRSTAPRCPWGTGETGR